jgi:hypothetical protein
VFGSPLSWVVVELATVGAGFILQNTTSPSMNPMTEMFYQLTMLSADMRRVSKHSNMFASSHLFNVETNGRHGRL